METVSVDVAQESDAGLLLLIGAADASSREDQALAREARREFHERHYGYVFAVLKGFAANVGTIVVDPKGFASATFQKAFKSAHAFRDKSRGDSIRSAAQVKAWLGVVASNLAKDELDRISRLQNHVQFVALDETHDVAEETPDSSDPTPTNPRALAALRKIIRGLKPEDRDVVATYGAFGIPTPNGRELPKEVREALERRTGFERSYIRKKWERLSHRLRSELEPLFSRP